MYAQHFGLAREPFSLAPDPRFLFMSDSHREALAHLLYGVRGGGGFVVLTGEIGAGKTTVARCFLEQLPAHCRVAYIYNPSLSVIELLQAICAEFAIAGVPPDAGGKQLVDALNAFLLKGHAQGKQALLVIDEAQALEPAVLEQLRLLTNLETAERKLLQIVLIGQPELRDMLAQPGLEQLSQRVIARYHLGPLSATDTRAYLEHRLGVAGSASGAALPMPFEPAAVAALHRLSRGVPRRLNLLADRALLGAYGQSRRSVDRALVERAAAEVMGTASGAAAAGGTGLSRRAAWALGATGVVALAATAGWAWQAGWLSVGPRPSAAPLAAAPPQAASQPLPPASLPGSVPGSVPASAPAPMATAVAAPPTRAPGLPPPTDDTAPLLAAAHSDEAIAWRELALRWNVAIGEGEPCSVAAAQARLACYRSAGGDLRLLRLLQRPVLLVMRGPTGLRLMATLEQLDERQAVLQVGAQRHVLTLAALSTLWRGEFATWWRLPPGWKGGERNPGPEARAWIGQQLARLQPATAQQPLRDQVAAFQIVQGLPADGVPQALTLMQLNRAAGIDEPRLLQPR